MGCLRWSVMLALASSACFHPDPSPGAPCGAGDTCPSGLMCIDGVCVTEAGSGSGSNPGECVDQPDGAPCGSAAMAECSARDTCMAGVCATNDRPDGSGCYDCAAGAGSCASCVAGACTDATCQPNGAPVPGILTSPLNANNADEGNMFDVVATQTITISSFDSHLGTTGSTDYEIWTRPGTYVGFEGSATGWTRVGSATFNGAGTGAFTAIPIPVNITIQAGQRQAFYLTNKTANNRYHDGTQVGATLASSPELTIYQGAGVNFGTNGFAGINTPRAWEGKIHYRSGGGATLATPMTGTMASAGIMFDVTPVRDLEVSLLAVHLGAGTHDVDVYFRRGSFAGVETTAAAWKKLASIMDVTSDGAARATPLPGSLGLFLDGGATTALYIQTTTSADVLSQPAMGGAANPELMIGQGVTVTGTFGAAGGTATPNVELGYGTCN